MSAESTPAFDHLSTALTVDVESEPEDEIDQLESDSDTGYGGSTSQNKPPSNVERRAAGQTLLPIARLESIIQAEGKTGSLSLSKEGLFLVSAATEEFIKRFVVCGQQHAKTEGRTGVHYTDMAATATQYQEFMFLKDIIPMPISLSDALKFREERENSMFDEDQCELVPTYPSILLQGSTSGQGPNQSTSSAKKNMGKYRLTNGTEKSNGYHPGHYEPHSLTWPTENASHSQSVLDARPWTNWTEVVQDPRYQLALLQNLPQLNGIDPSLSSTTQSNGIGSSHSGAVTPAEEDTSASKPSRTSSTTMPASSPHSAASLTPNLDSHLQSNHKSDEASGASIGPSAHIPGRTIYSHQNHSPS